MAHQTEIVVNGQTVEVTEFDHTAQEIDDMCDGLEAALPGNGGLPIAQGGTGATTPQAALNALGAGVRPNLLDNWYFVGGGSQQGGGQLPINQRGQTTYNVAGHIFDRWKLNGGTLVIDSDGISFSAGYILWKSLENIDFKDGQQRTVSYMDVNGNVYSGPFTAELSTVGDYAFAYHNTSNDFYCHAKEGSPKLQAIKLELGDTQTLAYQDEEGDWHLLPQPDSDYATQLAKCQRYLWVSPSQNGYSLLGYAIARSASMADLLINLPENMRDGGAPSMNSLNFSNLVFRNDNVNAPITTSGAVDGASCGDRCLINISGNFTAGEMYFVYLQNNEKLLLSREL